ncbi:MAG: POTRA domain-containing protein, partial [Candidatus Sericytochromatia bacterium]
MPNLNLNVNGRTVDPNSIRQIPVPEGETPESYVKKNEGLIRKNFRNELYFEHDKKLYVSEDKFVVDQLNPSKPNEAKLRVGSVPAVAVMIDKEPESHKVTDLTIEGASASTQEWIKKEIKVKTGDKVNLHDLQKQADKLFASNKFLSVDFSPSATDKGIKLTLKVQEVPDKIQFNGIAPNRQQALNQLFPKPLTRENIEKGMAALEAELEKDPQHLLRGLQSKIEGGQLQIMASLVEVPSQINIRGAAPADQDKIKGFFETQMNHTSIEKGIERLKDFYTKQGLVLPRMEFEVRGPQLLLDFATSPMPTRMEIKGVSVYPDAEVRKFFEQPLSMENIQKGMQALQKKYADDGYVLMPQKQDQASQGPPEMVSADLVKGVLTVNVHEAKMSDIVVTGNDKTQAEVITREL